MRKARVINGVTSFELYKAKLREHAYNKPITLLEIAGKLLEMADKKESIDCLDNAKIMIQNKFSHFLEEIKTEITITWEE